MRFDAEIRDCDLISRRRVFAVACALLYVSALVAWLVVGDLSESSVHNPDYVVWAPRVPIAAQWAGYALAAAMIALISTSWPRVAGSTIRAAWNRFAGATIASGLLLGAGGRILTAGTAGANIGAGMLAIVGLPALLLLALFAFDASRGLT